MPYDLFNPSTTICRTFSRHFFTKALELGRLYGWQPMGTQAPSNFDFYKLLTDWHGLYLTNDGQTVVSGDASSLAAALESSLDDIPGDNLKFDWDPNQWVEDDLPEWLTPEEREMLEDGLQEGMFEIAGLHPIRFFTGEEKRGLVEFIRFCRQGSFVIL